jgi:hypothetical protein
MTTDEIENAFNKVMVACRDLRMDNELERIMSKDYRPRIEGVEDQRKLKW